MNDYNKWLRRKLTATNIKLDINNPRLPKELFGIATQREIINYLFEKEKLMAIIKSIVKNNYWPNEMPYVTKEKNKFVVLEGNRRTAACKVILDATLAPKSKQKQINKIIKDFDFNIVKKIEVIISPTRDDVDIIIEARHTALQIEKWDPIKKARFYFYKLTQGESIKDIEQKFQTKGIKKHIRQYLLFEEATNLDFSEDELHMLSDESNLNLTTLERIVNFKSGQAFLGISFNSNGTFNRHIPEDEYKKRLKFFVREILNNNINSRSANKDEDLNIFIEKAFLEGDINKNVLPDPNKISEPINQISGVTTPESHGLEDKKPISKSSPKIKINTSLIPKDFFCNTGIPRIDEIILELQNLNINKSPNAIAVLFRSLLEMVTYQYINSNGLLEKLKKAKSLKDKEQNKHTRKKILTELKHLGFVLEIDPNQEFPKCLNGRLSSEWSPTLMMMLEFIISEKLLLSNVQVHSALKRYIGKNNEFLSHHDFNLFVHNPYSKPTKDELTDLWINLNGFIQLLIDNLNLKYTQKQKLQLSFEL